MELKVQINASSYFSSIAREKKKIANVFSIFSVYVYVCCDVHIELFTCFTLVSVSELFKQFKEKTYLHFSSLYFSIAIFIFYPVSLKYPLNIFLVFFLYLSTVFTSSR